MQNEKGRLVEILSTGAQCVVAPGAHKETGEAITWDVDGEPADVDADDLRTAVDKIAAGALLARHWPAQGTRDEFALALTGAVVRSATWTDDEIDHFIVAIAGAAHDEEAGLRGGKAKRAREAFSKRENVYGWPASRS